MIVWPSIITVQVGWNRNPFSGGYLSQKTLEACITFFSMNLVLQFILTLVVKHIHNETGEKGLKLRRMPKHTLFGSPETIIIWRHKVLLKVRRCLWQDALCLSHLWATKVIKIIARQSGLDIVKEILSRHTIKTISLETVKKSQPLQRVA